MTGSSRKNLCVVARRRRPLYDYLSMLFAARPDVEMVLDRREQVPDRRQCTQAAGIERRRRERRAGFIDADVARWGFGVLMVRRPRRDRRGACAH
jgi:hypothetical protein